MNKKEVKNQLIKVHNDEALAHFAKMKNSFRWKVGNAIARMLEIVLFRKPTKLSIDFLEEHLQVIQKLSDAEEDNSLADFKTIAFHHPQKIAILVSETNPNSIYGDRHVAHDFKIALEETISGVSCELIQYKDKIDYTTWDIVITMLWDTEIQLPEGDKKPLLIGWIRNYPDRWAANTSFIHYDLLLCSSVKVLDYISEHTTMPAYLFPIAGNVDRFHLDDGLPQSRRVCFVGNKFKEKRQIEDIIKSDDYEMTIYGKGWDEAEFGTKVKGTILNSEIPKLYQNSYIVLDSGNATTSEWESLNSRVYNAIAAKRIILTDSQKAASLFHYPVPTYTDITDLATKLKTYFENTATYEHDVENLFKELKSNHTYHHRANTFKLITGKKLNIAIKIAASEENRKLFGDLYFAEDLQSAFEVYKHKVRIDCYENWYSDQAHNDDLVIVLRGLRKYKPIAKQRTFLWLISHPEEVSEAEIQSYDHAFIASQYHTNQLQKAGIHTVSPLYQCTNPNKFYTLDEAVDKKKILLFVGNSRNVYRKSVQYAIELGLDLHVYGSGWESLIDEKYIQSDFVPNEELFKLYNKYDIILNDHWEDMINYGYLSNRVFDASACGTQLLTDMPKNCEDVLPSIYSFHDKESFKEKVNIIRKKEIFAFSNSYVVKNKHTFQKRSDILLNQYYQLVTNE